MVQTSTRRSRPGIATVERVAALLQVVARAPDGLRLTALAQALSIDAGLAHRYTRSLLSSGLLERTPARRFIVGARLREIAEADLDRVHASSFVPAVRTLHQSLGETIAILRWTAAGPQWVWAIDAAQTVPLTMRVGVTLPLLNTASGLICLAFAPAATLDPLLVEELKSLPPGSRPNRFDLADLRDATRKRGLARRGNFLRRVAAISAPLFDERERFWGAMTVLAPASRFDMRWRGPIASALRAFSTVERVPRGFDSALPSYRPVPFLGEVRLAHRL